MRKYGVQIRGDGFEEAASQVEHLCERCELLGRGEGDSASVASLQQDLEKELLLPNILRREGERCLDKMRTLVNNVSCRAFMLEQVPS